ncbi:MAG: HU family DNA-binding protein [Oscillospiraceae bacterium]|nr:HU family DNA-binding protein [Oscillospiraceae bacterium]
MNKTDFINEVAKRKGVSSRRAYREVNDVMDTLRVILSSGDDVQLGGFGTFEVLTDLRGERIPAFKGSKVLKLALNLNKE